MDWKTSLDWYCSGNTLDREDIHILETHYQQVLNSKDTEKSLEIAPKHICNQTKIPEGSLWIEAVAEALDRLRPNKNMKRKLIVEELIRNQSS